MSWIIYQPLTRPVFFEPEAVLESKWHEPWSEPVREKIRPALAVALIASGMFSPVINPTITPGQSYESQHHQPWSEPVRLKPDIGASRQQFFVYPYQKPLVSFAYYNWLSEPVRERAGLVAHLQQVDSLGFPVVPAPALLLQGWYNWLSEPVRELAGLEAWLQQSFAYHPRILPTPDVTGTMDGIETNEDVALFGINVYSSATSTGTADSANVSIAEVQAGNSGFGSIEET